MAKSATTRFDDTLANLNNEKAAGYKLGKDVSEAIKKWMAANPAKNKAMLGGKISLGGIRIMKSDNETYLRHLRRGILLAYLTIGGGGDAGLSALKKKIDKEKKDALRLRLKTYLPVAGQAATNKVVRAEGGFGTFELSKGSWSKANTLNEQSATRSFSKASMLLNKAFSQGIMRLGDSKQKAIYERWFGDSANAQNVATVKGNLKKIHDALCKRTVVLYYRGTGVDGEPTDLPIAEPWSPTGVMKTGSYFGAAWRVLDPRFDTTKSHMLLGSAFFSTTVHGTDSTAGVIIHELSHSECQTDDHNHPTQGVACYGHTLCQDIATSHTNLAITNADNYEFYCEEYWEGIYDEEPKATVVGKVPDDVKRRIAAVV